MQTERRAIQRDWVGHGLQLVAILVVIGGPLAFWGVSMNTTVATLSQRVDRQDHDITEQRQTQTLVTNQLLDVNKQLTRIDTLLGDVREQFKPKR